MKFGILVIYLNQLVRFSLYGDQSHHLGYIALSDIVVRGRQKPPNNIITCVPVEDTVRVKTINHLIWKDNNIICNVGSFLQCTKGNEAPRDIYDINSEYDGMTNNEENILEINASSINVYG